MAKRKNKTEHVSWFIIPNVLLCMALGFIGTLIFKFGYKEISFYEDDLQFLLINQVATIIFFLLGYFSHRFFKKHKNFRIIDTIMILLIFIIWLVVSRMTTTNIQIDYIFYTNFFLLFIFVVSFAFGLFLANLQDFRLWGFLTGVVLFIVYLLMNENFILNPKNYIPTFLFLLMSELTIIFIISHFKRIRIFEHDKTFLLESNIFFYPSVALFIFHIPIYYLVSSNNADSFLMGAPIGLLIFSIIYTTGIFRHKVKFKFYVGLIFFLANLYFSVNIAQIEKFFPIIFFLDTALIALFRPYRIRKKIYIVYSIIASLLMLFLVHQYPSYYPQIEARYFIITFFWISIILPFALESKLKLNTRFRVLFLSAIVVFTSFSIYQSENKLNFEVIETPRPIPFLFTNIDFNEDKFLFYKTTLPFKQLKKFPKTSELNNKIIVLELREEPETILTYINLLDKNKYPYIIFQQSHFPLIPEKLNHKHREYPFFRVYISNQIANMLGSEKELVPIQLDIDKKIKLTHSFQDLTEKLDGLHKNSNEETKQVLDEFRIIFYESYKAYAKYYFENYQYNYALQLISNCFQLKVDTEELMDTAFYSAMNVAPNEDQIPILKTLAEVSKFRELVLKKLYPVYITIGKHQEALTVMNELIIEYTKQEELKEVNNLKIEKVRIYLSNSTTYTDADSIIKKELIITPDSIAWMKLSKELYTLREVLNRKTIRTFYEENANIIQKLD